jgi:DNA-binding PadR family transcriptional regulator
VHKRLLLLGLLRRGPLSGYELHRIVRAHGDLYADMKKANIYYLLERLAGEGLVAVTVEFGTRGRRGERLIYELTQSGRDSLEQLVEDVLLDLSPTESGVAVAVVFMSTLPKRRALRLLRERRRRLIEKRQLTASQLSRGGSTLGTIAGDHLLARLDADIQWLERAVEIVSGAKWRDIQRGVA